MRLAAVFGDSAVLQRDSPLPVWGWTEPGRRVVVELDGGRAEGWADEYGRFRLTLPPRPAGGPHLLRVHRLGGDGAVDKTVVSRDVWIGEVWLASGQSNMGMNVNATGLDIEAHLREVVRSGNGKTAYPDGVRMFTVPHDARPGVADRVDARWEVADSVNIPRFSAVAYHFALRLHRELGVAVGVLHSSWGGTIIEAWTSRNTLVNNPDRRAWVLRHTDTVNAPDYWRSRIAGGLVGRDGRPEWSRDPVRDGAHWRPDPGNGAARRGWAAPDFDDAGWDTMPLPRPWTRAGHKKNGVFWFRRVVDIPAEYAGRNLLLEPGAADKQDIAYWNGEEIGRTGEGFQEVHWNQPRRYTVPGRLVKAGRNVVAFRVYSFVFDGGLIGPHMRAVPGGDLGAFDERAKAACAIGLAGPWRYRIEHDLGWLEPVNGSAGPAGPGNPNTPHILFDRMIRPLIPCALRGVVWYQGESNAKDAACARWYRRMMIDLVRDWRFHWGQGDFPVIQVQLAGYREPADYRGTDLWPLLRESQRLASREPGIGMVSALDVGEVADVHPKNKRVVGERLAAWALAKTYGRRDVAAHGPHYAGMDMEGQALRVRFTGTDGGLHTRDGKAPRTFFVAGSDRVFAAARVRIDGDTVVVYAESVPEPEAVRYAWSDNPETANLTNGAGLPASSFRTDHW